MLIKRRGCFKYISGTRNFFTGPLRQAARDNPHYIVAANNDMWPLAPPVRPLETLHNSLSLKQMNDFLDKVVSFPDST